jgi:HSP20 family protein
MLQLLNELTAIDPWREFDLFHRELNRALPRSVKPPVTTQQAPVNIYVKEDAVKVVARVPGWKPEWFDLSIEGANLHLKGKTQYTTGEGERIVQEELNRVVSLPFRAQDDQMKASYRDGVLTIDLVRSEQDRPKKIAINAA